MDTSEREKLEPIRDLEGNDVTDCDYCVAFQFRDWDTVEWMQDNGVGCTCGQPSGEDS